MVLIIFLNVFVCFGCLCFILRNVILRKVVKIMIVIVEVGLVFVKFKNGFSGSSLIICCGSDFVVIFFDFC